MKLLLLILLCLLLVGSAHAQTIEQKTPTAAIPAGSVTNSLLANMPATTIKCNASGVSAVPQDCTSLPAGLFTLPTITWANPPSLNTSNTWLFTAGNLTGTINTDGIDIGRVAPIMLVYTDTLAATCSICNNSATAATIWIHPKLAAGYDGFRFGIGVYMDEQSAPVSLNDNVVAGSFLNSVTQFNSTPGSINNADGSFWGINPNVFATANANALNELLIAGDETNVGVNTGSSTWRKLGYSIAVNGGDSVRGYLDDHAIQYGVKDGGVGLKPGWRVGISFSSVCCSTAPFSIVDSALIQTPRREVGSTTHQVTALYGVDFRQLVLGTNGASFAAANFAVDPNGYVDTGVVNVAQGIVQESAQLSSITILSPPSAYGPFQGGAYNVGGSNGTNQFPPIGIQAPLTGSVSATVTSMGLVTVTVPFGGVPASGCHNGDTVTVALNGTSGNTNGTFTVTVVGGNITAATVTSAGSYVSSAGDTGQSLSGGSCTAGTLTTNLSPYVMFNIGAVTPSGAGTFPCNTQPSVFVSGSGYIANVNTPAVFTGVLGTCTAAQVNLGTNGATWTGLTQINVNATSATNVGTGSTPNNVTLGGGSNKVVIGSPLLSGGTTFSVASGTGTCQATSGLHGGVQAGDFQCTTAGTAASTVTLTLTATTNAYSCWGRDVSTPTTVTQTGNRSTTSVTLTLTSVTSSDIIQFGCIGY